MIGKTLKEARMNINISQEEIAKTIGVTKQTYMKWENNVTEPKASQIIKLSQALQVSADEICHGRLYKRYSLQDFMYKMNEINASHTMQTLKFWEELNDHEGFFNSFQEDFSDPQKYKEQKDNELFIHYTDRTS